MFVIKNISRLQKVPEDLPSETDLHRLKCHVGLHTRPTVYLATLIIVTATIFTFMSYVTTKAQIRQDARERLASIAEAAALNVNGDLHAKLTRPFDKTNPAYRRIRDALLQIRNATRDIRNVYTLRWTPDSQLLMVVDQDHAPEAIAHLSDKYVSTTSRVLSSEFSAINQVALATEVYQDAHGYWMTGYAPIKTGDGKQEAILGIDISAAGLLQQEGALLKRVLAVFAGMIPLAFLFAFYIGRRFATPTDKLLQNIQRISSGTYDDAAAPVQDEMDHITATFKQTTAQLKQSVARLEQEVAIRRCAEQSLAERNRIEALSTDIGVVLAKGGNLATLLQQCADTLVKRMGAALARIWTLNASGEYLELKASAGCTNETDGYYSRIRLGENKIGIIARERRPLLINSVTESPYIDDKAWAEQEGLTAFVGHPIIANNEIIGVVALFIRNPLSNVITQALASVSYQIALGVKQKWAVNELQRSEEKYRTIVEGIHEGYFEVDLSGQFTFFNDALCKITGYTRQDLTGVKSLKYANAESAKAMYQIFSQVYISGKPVSVSDFGLIAKGGRSIVVELSASLICDANEGKVGFRGIMRDISDKLRIENQKRKLEKQLQHSRKLESIGTLAGGIAHDFNNLLMGIQGNASLMQLKLEKDHPFHKKINTIMTLVESGADLTKQLLGFAKGGTYLFTPASINEVIQRSVQLFGRTHKNINIEKFLQKNLSLVSIDRGHIEQVIFNILNNAADAMPNGGHIAIQTTNVSLSERITKAYNRQAGQYILIAIRDTGCGMAPKTIQRIFDPFFTTKELGHGTGLGLAAVYGIIQNHKGFITVGSEPGQGTNFKIYLPATQKRAPLPPRKENTIHKGSETILLVDDEDVMQDIGAQMLEILGYRVIVARSGQEAIKLFSEKQDDIDLIILDMIMPGLSGGETYKELRKRKSNLKVILASGYSEDEQAQTILKDSGNQFIQKPFRLNQLAMMIRTLLDTAGPAAFN